MRHLITILLMSAGLAVGPAACSDPFQCGDDYDCPSTKVCVSGECVEFVCEVDEDCSDPNATCQENKCISP
jgi:hypothetical protein